MKAPVSWMREFADLPASTSVNDIAAAVAGVGFEVAGRLAVISKSITSPSMPATSKPTPATRAT